MIKINFKQPKYVFPAVIFVPLCALVYFVMQVFKGNDADGQEVATDRINMELPEANAEEARDKMYEMSHRFGDRDAFTAVAAIGEEKKDEERLDAAEAERIRRQRELEELERSLAESRRHINSYAYGDPSGAGSDTGGGYGFGISGEAIALQALQNMYNSATSALSFNIRKNKAKIKYNTIVYLINSDDAR